MKQIIILQCFLTIVSCEIFLGFPGQVPGYHEDGVHTGRDAAKVFLGEWTVQVDGGPEVAELLALELGYVYGGQVLGFPDTYVFYAPSHTMQRRGGAGGSGGSSTRRLDDRRIKWAEQLFSKTRVKRYPLQDSDKPLTRVKRVENDTQPDGGSRKKREFTENLFNDELWSHEWYLQDTRTRSNLPRLDLNVLPVYAMGINGSGVRVTVLDDGLEHNHTDLRANYDPEISWDCNDHDADPSPRYETRNMNSHGTRCAGEIAMTANNKKCGVGVAYGARIGGIRLLDGQITDRVEGEAIGFGWDKVDIYSASWGPDDDGTTVEGPGKLAIDAIIRGINKGRKGKGVIYVWANGNGGSNHDNCNCDGYSSSIYTVSIASASQHGLFPWYGEICSSTLATTYSSGAYKEQKIATTDIGNTCTLRHTGTSAAAPLAAGIIALALSANPELTWRDVQHLIVWTSDYIPLSSNPGWQVNGVGLRFDIRFGFGLLNAGALVSAALNWTQVPEKYTCRFPNLSLAKDPVVITPESPALLSFSVDKCQVQYAEHVEVVVTVHYTRRGALQVQLTSPLGTKVPLLSARPKDKSSAGFVQWPLSSVATWGEQPAGLWTVDILDETNEVNSGEITSMTLVIHGTEKMPKHMQNGPRNYATENDYEYEQDENEIMYYNNEIDDAGLIPGLEDDRSIGTEYLSHLAVMH